MSVKIDSNDEIGFMTIDRTDFAAMARQEQIRHLEVEGYVAFPRILDGERIARIKREMAHAETWHPDYSPKQERSATQPQWLLAPLLNQDHVLSCTVVYDFIPLDMPIYTPRPSSRLGYLHNLLWLKHFDLFCPLSRERPLAAEKMEQGSTPQGQCQTKGASQLSSQGQCLLTPLQALLWIT